MIKGKKKRNIRKEGNERKIIGRAKKKKRRQ